LTLKRISINRRGGLVRDSCPDTLTAALTQERQSLDLLTAYGTSLADAVERLKSVQSKLGKVGRAAS